MPTHLTAIQGSGVCHSHASELKDSADNVSLGTTGKVYFRKNE